MQGSPEEPSYTARLATTVSWSIGSIAQIMVGFPRLGAPFERGCIGVLYGLYRYNAKELHTTI